MEIRHLNWKEFTEQYDPIKNLFDKDAACDGHMFTESEHLRDVPNTKLWSLIHDTQNDDMYITNGMRIINKIGHLVSKVEWSPEETIEVRLEDGYEVKDGEN